MNILQRKLILSLLLLAGVIIIGIAGYILIEHWNLIDSLFMTVISLTTVGYGEVRPLSTSGRIFSMALILGGMGVIVYGVSNLTAFVVEGELKDILRRKKMEDKINKLKDHYIVCGAGKTASCIIEELYKTKRDYVVIEKDLEKIKSLPVDGPLFIEGDATEDSILLNAGIKRAKGLISALSKDEDNVFVVLTARELNPELRIVSKCVENSSQNKFKKAGADSIVFPHSIGGLRIASEMLRPKVVDFLDTMLRDRKSTLRIEEIKIGSMALVAGKTLHQLNIKKDIDAVIVAMKRGEETIYKFNPVRNTPLQENDVIIVMGDTDQINKLQQLLK